MNLCEIPFVSATALDETLTSSGPGRSAIQKYRQEMRRTLDPGKLISMGRAGTVQLTSVPALACVATASRWNMKDAHKLADAFRKAGFNQLKKSASYCRIQTLMGEAVKARVRGADTEGSKTAMTDLIPGCWESLHGDPKVVRRVICAMHEILMKVDEELDQMKRFPGRLVRFEGDSALVTIDTGEREELRLVDGAYLRSAGISRNGAPFVLHEYRWSPDTTMSVYFPAFDLDRDEAAEDELIARLDRREKPLPEPPPGLVPVDAAPVRSRELARPAKAGARGKVKHAAARAAAV
jgi:hypothetical protein